MAQQEERYELKQVRIQLKEAAPLYSSKSIDSPEAAIHIMSEAIASMDREYCCVVNLDAKFRPLNFNVVSIGDTSSAVVPLQNVFKSAILSNAGAVMMFHNHPSGVLKPSLDDISLTQKLVEAGKLINIPVLDHVIVGGDRGAYYSFRESSSISFDNPYRPEPPDFSAGERKTGKYVPADRAGDRFSVYRIRAGGVYEGPGRAGYGADGRRKVHMEDYRKVREGRLAAGRGIEDIRMMHGPAGPGKSPDPILRQGDVIVLERGGRRTAFLYGASGFKKVEGFKPGMDKTPLKKRPGSGKVKEAAVKL